MNDVEWGVMPILDEKLQYIVKKPSKNYIMAELMCFSNAYLNESPLKAILFKRAYKDSPQSYLKVYL